MPHAHRRSPHTFVGEVDSEVIQLYHNVTLKPLSGIAVQFLFARLAWTIFGFLTVFLNRVVQRALRVRDTDGIGYVTKTFSDAQCMEKARLARSRSLSPKKRKPDIPEERQDAMEDELTDLEVGGVERDGVARFHPQDIPFQADLAQAVRFPITIQTGHSEVNWKHQDTTKKYGDCLNSKFND